MKTLPIVEWIGVKRDGFALDSKAINSLVAGFVRGDVGDAQMSALLMAINLNGMTLAETIALTESMLHSGKILRGTGGDRPRIDKHSTGGVGDKISLCLAPLVAACGVDVPMIAGRGLGHTGGTLDKLESIEGYKTQLSTSRFAAIVSKVGVSIIGQTAEIAPADQKMYALRDVTGTVPSAPLIVASILSKKLAAGLDALIMDVKVGRGAFMTSPEAAMQLASLLKKVGKRLGTPVRGLVTEMSEPIGKTIGNSLEMAEAIAILRGEGPADTLELTLRLGEEMLKAAGVTRSAATARKQLLTAISDGAGAERLEKMIAAHGGDAKVVASPLRLPQAPHKVLVKASSFGVVQFVDALELGHSAVALGAGRSQMDQDIDPCIGIELLVRAGEPITAGQPLAALHLTARSVNPAIRKRIANAFVLGSKRVRSKSRIVAKI